MGPDLLEDTVRRLAAEHDLRTALVGLDLSENGLDLPALTIERGQLPGRITAGSTRVVTRRKSPATAAPPVSLSW